jgi:DNA-binding transcriptional regulator YiaG
MAKHEKEGLHAGGLDVLERAGCVLAAYDATALVGLKTIIHNAAVQHGEDDEASIEVPKLRELLAAAAVARCLMPAKLHGGEIKAMRRILDLTIAQMAARMGTRTATETVCRWETEVQPMGAYAEKVYRLLVCEALAGDAPGVEYHASALADLAIADQRDAAEEPIVHLCYMPMKQGSGEITKTYNDKLAA